MSTSPRILTIMGSGETAPTMMKHHRELIARFSGTPKAVVLDTPYGFQENASELASKAVEYFRKRVGEPLHKLGFNFQHQPYDHVLKDEEKLEQAIINLVEYIARNPERKNLVGIDKFKSYPFTDCLVPGYPELRIWEPDFWLRFWRCYAFLTKNGPFRSADEELN